MERIRIYKQGGIWMAAHSDPQVAELFGTSRLPTPYPDSVPMGDVQSRIQSLNPDRLVVTTCLEVLDSIIVTDKDFASLAETEGF